MVDSHTTNRDATSGKSSPVTNLSELRQARQSHATSTPTSPSTSLDAVTPSPPPNTGGQVTPPHITISPVESAISRQSSSPIGLAALLPLRPRPQPNSEMSLPPRLFSSSPSSDGGAPLPPDMLPGGQDAGLSQARRTQSGDDWTLVDTFDESGLADDGFESLEEARSHLCSLTISTAGDGGQHSVEQCRLDQSDEIKATNEHDNDNNNGKEQQGELQSERGAEHDAELEGEHVEEAHQGASDAPSGEYDQPGQSWSSADVPIPKLWTDFSHQSVHDALDKLQLPEHELAGGWTKQLVLQLAIQFAFKNYPWLDSFQRDIPLLGNIYSTGDLAAAFYVQYGVVIWSVDDTVGGFNDSIIEELTNLFDTMRTGDYHRESYPADSRDTFESLVGRSGAVYRYDPNSSHNAPNASASTHGPESQSSLHDHFLDLRIDTSLDVQMTEILLRSAVAQLALEVLNVFSSTKVKTLGPKLAKPSVEITRNIRDGVRRRYKSRLWPNKEQLSMRDLKALEKYISAVMTLSATEDSLRASGSSPLNTLDIFLQSGDAGANSDGVHYTCPLAPIVDEEFCQKTFASEKDLTHHLVQVHDFGEREAKDSAADCSYSLRHQKDEE